MNLEVAVSLIFSISFARIWAAEPENLFFTAQIALENLVETQQSVLELFGTYFEKECARVDQIHQIKQILERWRYTGNIGRSSAAEFVANPLNAFGLLREMSVDLNNLVSMAEDLTNSNGLGMALDYLKKARNFPTLVDLKGAAEGILRLQHTYHLNASTMAAGDLGSGHCCVAEFNADDCFEIGRYAHDREDHHFAVAWLNEALLRVEPQNTTNSISEARILDHFAPSMYNIGRISEAIVLTERLLALDPNNRRAATDLVYFKKQQTNIIAEQMQIRRAASQSSKRAQRFGFDMSRYEALCRQGIHETQASHMGTKCEYATNGEPYLLIGPLKQELVNVKPAMYLYHEVVFDREIEIIKQLAQNRWDVEKRDKSNFKVSKPADLGPNDHPVIRAVYRRISMATGLDLETAEGMLVANYGLGGHYEPHYDHDVISWGTGHRIATWMLYMSDIEAGGATAFPFLNVAMWPRKGSAAFWFNLHEDGQSDFITWHGACPVLLGSKWVSNTWIRERGQEFRRPCNLQPSEGIPLQRVFGQER